LSQIGYVRCFAFSISIVAAGRKKCKAKGIFLAFLGKSGYPTFVPGKLAVLDVLAKGTKGLPTCGNFCLVDRRWLLRVLRVYLLVKAIMLRYNMA
jgi:hypothetical protein